MDAKDSVEIIKQKFVSVGGNARIPLQKSKYFTALADDKGVRVSNLGTSPLLPWRVFEETLLFIERNGGRAIRGNAMDYKLGETGLPSTQLKATLPRLSLVNNRVFLLLDESHQSLPSSSGLASAAPNQVN